MSRLTSPFLVLFLLVLPMQLQEQPAPRKGTNGVTKFYTSVLTHEGKLDNGMNKYGILLLSNSEQPLYAEWTVDVTSFSGKKDLRGVRDVKIDQVRFFEPSYMPVPPGWFGDRNWYENRMIAIQLLEKQISKTTITTPRLPWLREVGFQIALGTPFIGVDDKTGPDLRTVVYVNFVASTNPRSVHNLLSLQYTVNSAGDGYDLLGKINPEYTTTIWEIDGDPNPLPQSFYSRVVPNQQFNQYSGVTGSKYWLQVPKVYNRSGGGQLEFVVETGSGSGPVTWRGGPITVGDIQQYP